MSLRRYLKFPHLIATVIGTPLGASTFLNVVFLITIVGTNGTDLILSLALSSCIVIIMTFAYGELVSIYPTAAGVRMFLKKPIGDKYAIVASIYWILAILLAAGDEAYIFGAVLNNLFPQISTFTWVFIGLTVILIVNSLGIEVAGTWQMIVTIVIVITLLAASAFSFATPGPMGNLVFSSPSLANILFASSISVYFFIGFGRVSTLGEESKDYKRSLPIAMIMGISVLAVIITVLCLAIVNSVPFSFLQNTSLPQIELGQFLLGRSFAIILALVSILMSFGAFNAGVLGTSRLIYALGREKILPKTFSKLNRFIVPYASLFFLYGFALVATAIVFLTNNTEIPIIVAVGGDSFVYALIAYSALWHARKLSRDDIPFYVPYSKWLFAIVSVVFLVLGVLAFASASTIQASLLAIGITLTIFVLVYFYINHRIKRISSLTYANTTKRVMDPNAELTE